MFRYSFIALLLSLFLLPATTHARVKRIACGSGDSITLQLIPSGSFTMGSSIMINAQQLATAYGGDAAAYEDEFPIHDVAVDSFWMSAYEITVAQFAQFVAATRYKTSADSAKKAYFFDGQKWILKKKISWKRPGFPQEENHPAAYISWYDAQAFCQWLSKESGLTFTLPTEEQWEYAARAGTRSLYFWGNDANVPGGYANVADARLKDVFPNKKTFSWNDGYVYTAPVGTYKPNAFGLYDMTGNVWEWCADIYSPTAYSKKTDTTTNLALPVKHTLRGGCWLNDPAGSRVSDRNGWPLPTDSYGGYGFRIVVAAK